MKTPEDAERIARAAVDALIRHYDTAVATLREAVADFIADGTVPDPARRSDGSFAYPQLRLTFSRHPDALPPPRAYGRLSELGTYATTITRPALFAEYLVEQIALLVRDYGVAVDVRPSRQEIPFPYVLEPGHDLTLDGVAPTALARWFPATELASIGDEIADGRPYADPDAPLPLALFDALRVDFSLARLRHYTGTPSEHAQRYILFTCPPACPPLRAEVGCV